MTDAAYQQFVPRAGSLKRSGVSGEARTADDVLDRLDAAKRSARTLYAGQLGAALDGVADDTAVLAAALATASAANPIRLVLDGPACLTSGLDARSGTTIDARGCTVTQKAGSNRQLLRNANRTRGTIVDAGIEVVGGVWDANRGNQTGGGVVGTQMPDNTYMAGIGFYGVSGLRLDGLTIRNALAFGLHLANWSNVWVRDVWVDNNGGTSTQDGIHCNGPCSVGHFRGLRLTGYDDVFALCADDGTDDISVSDAFGPYVGTGAISDVEVDGITLTDSLFGVRVMSRTSRVDRVRIHGIRGRCLNYWGIVDGFAGSNNGNYGSIDLEADVYCHDPVAGPDVGGLVVCNNVERLTVRCTRHDWASNRSAVLVKAGATVDQFDCDLSIRDAVGGAPQGPVSVLGRVKSLRLSGNWYSSDPAATGGLLYAVGGQVDRATLDAVVPATCSKVYPGGTVALAGGDAAVIPHKEIVLSSATISPGATYANVGNLSLTATDGPGDYRLTADVRVTGGGSDALVVRLAVGGVAVVNSERQCVAPAGFEGHTAGLTWDLPGLAGGEAVTLQAVYEGAATVAVLSDAHGRTVLRYAKLGY